MFLRFYPGINFFPTGGNYFLNWKEIFFLTGEILGSNCGHGEELADEEELRRGDSFRIKDDIILAKSVSITEKAVYLRRFFANKVKKQDAKRLRRSMKHLRRDWFNKKRIIIDILRSI